MLKFFKKLSSEDDQKRHRHTLSLFESKPLKEIKVLAFSEGLNGVVAFTVNG